MLKIKNRIFETEDFKVQICLISEGESTFWKNIFNKKNRKCERWLKIAFKMDKTASYVLGFILRALSSI